MRQIRVEFWLGADAFLRAQRAPLPFVLQIVPPCPPVVGLRLRLPAPAPPLTSLLASFSLLRVISMYVCHCKFFTAGDDHAVQKAAECPFLPPLSLPEVRLRPLKRRGNDRARHRVLLEGQKFCPGKYGTTLPLWLHWWRSMPAGNNCELLQYLCSALPLAR